MKNEKIFQLIGIGVAEIYLVSDKHLPGTVSSNKQKMYDMMIYNKDLNLFLIVGVFNFSLFKFLFLACKCSCLEVMIRWSL